MHAFKVLADLARLVSSLLSVINLLLKVSNDNTAAFIIVVAAKYFINGSFGFHKMGNFVYESIKHKEFFSLYSIRKTYSVSGKQTMRMSPEVRVVGRSKLAHCINAAQR